jgi:hypothetical protein
MEAQGDVFDDDGYGEAGQSDSAFLHFEPRVEDKNDIATREIIEPRRPAKKRNKKGQVMDNGDWEAGLRNTIISDVELHLKILRYEPIPIDAFMKKVGIEPSAQAQKMKLRKLLDELGVNSYAVTGTVGRRKRH